MPLRDIKALKTYADGRVTRCLPTTKILYALFDHFHDGNASGRPVQRRHTSIEFAAAFRKSAAMQSSGLPMKPAFSKELFDSKKHKVEDVKISISSTVCTILDGDTSEVLASFSCLDVMDITLCKESGDSSANGIGICLDFEDSAFARFFTISASFSELATYMSALSSAAFSVTSNRSWVGNSKAKKKKGGLFALR